MLITIDGIAMFIPLTEEAWLPHMGTSPYTDIDLKHLYQY